MGMITRIRGRLRGSVHTIPKLDKKLRDEKIAETGNFFLHRKKNFKKGLSGFLSYFHLFY